MRSFLRTPLFWLIFASASIAAAAATYYLFPKAYPIVHLNITMDRQEAIEKTKMVAQELSINIQNPLYAASFYTDDHVKTFVELEAGGKDTFIDLIDNNLYEPYTWLVRQFKPYDQHQLFVRFTPEGIPYSFEEIISEEALGTNISAQQAQEMVESFAVQKPWNIDFSPFKLVESSQETTPLGRIDHKLTYERIDKTIGEGFFQLKFVVSADKITKLAHAIKVPEAFNRRYAQMRSANANIAYIASLLLLVLYVLGCGLIGLVVLFNENWIIWKKPLYWATFIAFLNALNIPNKLPLSWLNYATSLSPAGFLFQHAISMLYTFIFLTIALSLIFIAAESLTRKAFGSHLQLWHLFRRDYASTITVFGYTISGYLFVPIVLCYTMIFTLLTMNRAGWWIPSSTLFNPDILATYFPWLESISLSLQAGFMEECLFRAIPLSSAALLGKKFGKRTWWIAGAFILQAVIFGAAHANYPAQPAYARLVELLADSALFGGIFLWLGLLPAIIAHFIYDVFWFALPIFVAATNEAFINKVIIIIASLIPLGIVLISRLKTGTWSSPTQSMYNQAWQPTESDYTPHSEIKTQSIFLPTKKIILIITLGIIGLSLWAGFSRFSDDAPSMSISRLQAQKTALKEAQKNGIDIAQWYPITFAMVSYEQNSELNKQQRFIWQTQTPSIYHSLLNSYLVAPQWITRLVKFDGPIVQRAEEYQIYTNTDGSLGRFIHKLPETKAGSSLTKEAAIQVAINASMNAYQLNSSQLSTLNAIATKQPSRLDWQVTFLDNSKQNMDNGQARIIVTVSGDEVTDMYRSIHVPERWERSEENMLMFSHIIAQICQLLVYLLTIVGTIIALMQWHQGTTVSLNGIFFLLAIIFLFELFNSWPHVFSTFNTSQPFMDQLFRAFSLSSFMLIARAGALAILFNFVSFTQTKYKISQWLSTLFAGISFGGLFAGLQAFLQWAIPSTKPLWANLTPIRFALPLTAGINSTFLHFISTTIFVLLYTLILNKISSYAVKRIWALAIVLALAGYLNAGLLYSDNLQLFGFAGAAFGLLYALIYWSIARFDLAVIPIMIATNTMLDSIKEIIFHGYYQSTIVGISTIVIIGLSGYWWSRKINTISEYRTESIPK